MVLCGHANERSLKIASHLSRAEDKDEVSAINRHLLEASKEMQHKQPGALSRKHPASPGEEEGPRGEE